MQALHLCGAGLPLRNSLLYTDQECGRDGRMTTPPMAAIHTIDLAGVACMLVATVQTGGWQVAGYFRDRAVVVEGLHSEPEALDAWICKALILRDSQPIQAG